MKKITALLALIFSLSAVLAFVGCGGNNENERNDQTPVQQTISAISGVDGLGRVTYASGKDNKKDVGIFYFLWLGAHSSGIYDISVLLDKYPEYLWTDEDNEFSAMNRYHFWSEPLYGYYDSDDPWVLTRHVELLTMAGIDFIGFDTTNGVLYENTVASLMFILDKYQKQGFDVPKVMFLLNSGHGKDAMRRVYENFYKEGAPFYYPNLWYSPEGKPLIAANDTFYDVTTLGENATAEERELYEGISNLFQVKNTDWPNCTLLIPPQEHDYENGFPWIDWVYPQANFNGTMTVSVAQHTNSKMSTQSANWGRGYSFEDYTNSSDRVLEGNNFKEQWDWVFETVDNAKNGRKDFLGNPIQDIDRVFVTGWNEWIAAKFPETGAGAKCYFVDQFNMEYSRDIEMMKGGFGDNFYMQLVQNVKKFKFEERENVKSVSLTPLTDEDWKKATTYLDFNGDAMERDFDGYPGSKKSGTTKGTPHYTDTTNRNDIVEVKTAHDKKYAYFKVTCANDIEEYQAGDTNFMNIWLKFSTSSVGYEYVINREYGKLSKITEDGYETAGDVDVNVDGKVMTVRVPLSLMGKSFKDYAVMFKVSDNVDASDVMNFYIQGDSAPIGRLSYTYGNVK